MKKILYFLLLSIHLISLDVVWDFPPKNHPNAIATNVSPDIAYNIDCIGVAVWQDAAGGAALHSARLNNGIWQALPIIPTIILIESPKVGIDDDGQAVCIWKDSASPLGVINAARLNGTTWTFFPPLEPTPSSELQELAVSRGGSALAIWNRPAAGTEIRMYDKDTDTWLPPLILSPSTIVGTYSISINPAGLAAAAFNNSDGSIQASYYDRFSWVTEMVSATGSDPNVVINDNGDALLTWVESGMIFSAYNMGGGWAPIASTIGSSSEKPKAALFNDGIGLVVWTDTILSTIRGARYDGAAWTEFAKPISGSLNTDSEACLASNSEGRAVATWCLSGSGKVSVASYDENIWNPERTVSSPNTHSIVGSMNAFGDIALGWINFTSKASTLAEGAGSNALTGSFAELPCLPGNFAPTNVKVCVTPNRFLTQSFFHFCITWTASIEPSVTCYRIYRNGKFLAEVSAKGPLCFEDCTGCCKTLYQVSAVTNQGIESKKVRAS